MIICHASDWHACRSKNNEGEIVSIFPDIKEEFDVFVMSGDFLPNSIWGANRKLKQLPFEKKYQENWLHLFAEDIKKCIHDKPFLWSSGNHDFINPCKILIEHGINAIDLDNKVIEFMNYIWIGFPYIPIMDNHWNFERNSNDMRSEIITMKNRLIQTNNLDKLNIIVAHCPPANILDWTGAEHIGNSHINNFISYELPNLPKLYLCGHNHSDFGKIVTIDSLDRTEQMIISNAATTYNILTVD